MKKSLEKIDGKKILIFSIILYGEKQATYRKVFQDKEFWEEIEANTSDRWLLLCHRDRVEFEFSNKSSRLPDGVFGHILSSQLNFSGTLKERHGYIAKECFGIDKPEFPLMVFFTSENFRVISLDIKKTDSDMNTYLSEICGRVSKVLEAVVVNKDMCEITVLNNIINELENTFSKSLIRVVVSETLSFFRLSKLKDELCKKVDS